MVLAKFRQHYPNGSLVSELVGTDRGTYIVKVSAIVNETILATGLAGADRVEMAEDSARERAIALLMLDSHDTASQTKDGVSEAKYQKENVTIAPQPSLSNKSAPPLTIAREQGETNNSSRVEDNKVVDFADYPAKETQSYSVPPESDFPPETDTEIVDNGRIIEEVVEPQEVAANSVNLFEGTSDSDSDLISQDFSPEEDVSTESSSTVLEEVNFNEIKHQTDLEIKRLGWTKNDGREFLKSRYGKRSRLQLTDNQLLEFLQYLASQPSPS